jgi:hypothetical protein
LTNSDHFIEITIMLYTEAKIIIQKHICVIVCRRKVKKGRRKKKKERKKEKRKKERFCSFLFT